MSQKSLEHTERLKNASLDGASPFSCQGASQGNWSLKLGALGGWDETGFGHVAAPLFPALIQKVFLGMGLD